MATYSTTDFYITALLLSLNYEVLEVTSGDLNKRVKTFHFEDSENLRAQVLKFMNGSLEGNLKAFKDSIETVKVMVHSG